MAEGNRFVRITGSTVGVMSVQYGFWIWVHQHERRTVVQSGGCPVIKETARTNITEVWVLRALGTTGKQMWICCFVVGMLCKSSGESKTCSRCTGDEQSNGWHRGLGMCA